VEPTIGSFEVETEKLSLNQLKSRFPFEGSFHFRCKVVPSSDQTTYIWLDLEDDNAVLVSYDNIVSVKALPLDSLLGDDPEQEWPYLPSQYAHVRDSINKRIEAVSNEIQQSVSKRSNVSAEEGAEEDEFDDSEIDNDLQPYPGMQDEHSSTASVTSAIKGFFTSATSAIEKAAEKLTHHSQASYSSANSASANAASPTAPAPGSTSTSAGSNFMSGLSKGFQRVKLAAASAVAAATGTGEGGTSSSEQSRLPAGKGAVFTTQ
jgi:hypothetical protein